MVLAGISLFALLRCPLECLKSLFRLPCLNLDQTSFGLCTYFCDSEPLR